MYSFWSDRSLKNILMGKSHLKKGKFKTCLTSFISSSNKIWCFRESVLNKDNRSSSWCTSSISSHLITGSFYLLSTLSCLLIWKFWFLLIFRISDQLFLLFFAFPWCVSFEVEWPEVYAVVRYAGEILLSDTAILLV